MVKRAWERNQRFSRLFRLQHRIKECRVALLEWNRKLKNNARKEIQEMKLKINEVQNEKNQNKTDKLNELPKRVIEVYKREEIYWGRKSRIKWLKKGDKNRSYFHAIVAGRRKRTAITNLQKKNGDWCNSEKKIEEEITYYFQKLFKTTQLDHCDAIFEGIPQTITSQMNSKLVRSVIEAEIRKAVFVLHPNKAPEPDGMTPIFFQMFWNIIKYNLIAAIGSFFHSSNMLKAINETIVTLIPKIPYPVLVSQYRPISLCNVVYRIISKIMVNRLKPI